MWGGDQQMDSTHLAAHLKECLQFGGQQEAYFSFFLGFQKAGIVLFKMIFDFPQPLGMGKVSGTQQMNALPLSPNNQVGDAHLRGGGLGES